MRGHACGVLGQANMRILASNPDNIGDLVLRQPMYAALRAAGHDLTLVVRSWALPMMPVLAPGAQAIALDLNPYDPSPDWDRAAPAIQAARDFRPDTLLIASYQWTPFEERLAASLPDVPVVGMTGKLYPGDPLGGLRNESSLQFHRQADVAEDLPELRKNELLASVLLGRTVELPRPSITASPAQLQNAKTCLQRAGLDGQDYWIACVGADRYTQVRNWDPAAWAGLLSAWANRYGRKFVFVGNDAETPAIREVIDAMGEAGRRSAFHSATGNTLETLIGLLSLSQGYVGRDTGPMHLAAALGKPVLAVFGGGTWPRFLPAAVRSRVHTIAVPCVGCDWHCHMECSHCVKDVPVDDVLQSVNDLEAGRVQGNEVRQLPADPGLLARMVREGRDVAAERLFDLGRAVRQARLAEADADGLQERDQRTIAELRATVSELQRRDEHRLAEQARAEDRLRQLLARVDELQDRLSTAQVAAADAQVSLAAARQERDLLLTQTRQLESELTRAAAAHAQGAAAEADLARVREELRAARSLAERMSASKWHRLGGAIGLKLESARLLPPAPGDNGSTAGGT